MNSQVSRLSPTSDPKVALRPVPVARGLPLLGVLPRFLFEAPHQVLAQVALAHPGEVVAVPFGPMRVYLVTDPSHIEHVLHTGWRNYTKDGPLWEPMRYMLGRGLLTGDGDTWVASRRVAQPLFHASYLSTLGKQMAETIERKLDELAARVGSGREIDMAREMVLFTQCVILEAVFGVRIENEEADRLARAVSTALAVLSQRAVLPFMPRSVIFGKRLLLRASQTIDEGVTQLTRRAAASGDRLSIIELLRQSRNTDSGKPLSEKQVRDELVTLWFAGNETTATAMTWLWHVLDREPQLVERLHAEVRREIGARRPRYEDVERLTLCRQTFLEATRLYPPGFLLPRHCAVDDVIDGYRIPEGAVVMVNVYGAHVDPRAWEDPERFDPDRFTPERVAARHRYAYVGFGGGPRRCIGEGFAILEGTLLTASILQRFRLRVRPGFVARVQPSTTLRMRGGLPMRIEPRRDA